MPCRCYSGMRWAFASPCWSMLFHCSVLQGNAIARLFSAFPLPYSAGNALLSLRPALPRLCDALYCHLCLGWAILCYRCCRGSLLYYELPTLCSAAPNPCNSKVCSAVALLCFASHSVAIPLPLPLPSSALLCRSLAVPLYAMPSLRIALSSRSFAPHCLDTPSRR